MTKKLKNKLLKISEKLNAISDEIREEIDEINMKDEWEKDFDDEEIEEMEQIIDKIWEMTIEIESWC